MGVAKQPPPGCKWTWPSARRYGELMYILRCEILSPVSMRDTFGRFRRSLQPCEDHTALAEFSNHHSSALKMREGLRIEYRIKWLGVPVYWRTAITAYEPPFFFVDEQEKGQYVLWRHRHTLNRPNKARVSGSGGIYFPLGALGRTAHELLIGRQLKNLFEYRQRALKEFFGGGAQFGKSPLLGRNDAEVSPQELPVRKLIGAEPALHLRGYSLES